MLVFFSIPNLKKNGNKKVLPYTLTVSMYIIIRVASPRYKNANREGKKSVFLARTSIFNSV